MIAKITNQNCSFKKISHIFFIIVCGLVLVALQGCAKQKNRQDLNAEELRSKALAYIQKKDYDAAVNYLEQLITKNPDHPQIAKYKLLLAESCFKAGRYPSATQLFEHYNQFYPSDQRAEYSKYKALLSKFYQTLRTDCDQTETEETVKICQEYLNNPAYTKYRTDVADIKRTCEQKLIDKEVYVFNFYMKQEKYDSAENRLKYLRKTYLPNNSALEARLLYLECKLAQKQKNQEKIKESLEKLVSQYPESQFTQMAEALTTKSPFFF